MKKITIAVAVAAREEKNGRAAEIDLKKKIVFYA
jgi:hypothetical protein